jgi:hypothetical protein
VDSSAAAAIATGNTTAASNGRGRGIMRRAEAN